jgi:phosphoribosylaminoimidazole carboxylase
VAINNSINATLLAARIIGSFDESVRSRIEKYAADMQSVVLEKAERLEQGGWEDYGLEKLPPS